MAEPAREPHTYDSLFYRYQREGAARSAACALPVLTKLLRIGSVLDVGCGAGAWLAAHRDIGVTDVIGVDGDYVDRSMLLVDAPSFRPLDITQPFDFDRQFDLVQCLEVAEHVPHGASAALVDNLVRHGRQVLFSAAVPGQGGEDHVNEQPYTFWRDLFAARGYRLFDFVRPRIAHELAIEPWYRYNILFFAHDSMLESLPTDVLASRVGDRLPIRDFSPPGYRLRKAVLRHLPSGLVSKLAVWKHRRMVRALLGE